MIVDSVYGNTVYLKNCGYGVITNDSLGVYLDDTPLRFNMTPQTIGKGGVGTININASDMAGIIKGDHNLKITNPNSQTVQSIEAVLPSSCVMDLEFDEGSGTTAHDSSGNGNDGTLVNGPQWVDGKFGKALKYDGVDDYVTVKNSESLKSPGITKGITVEGWIKLGNVVVEDKIHTIAQKGFGEHTGFWLAADMRIPGVWWEIGDGSSNFINCNAAFGFSKNVWYHIVGTYDGNKMRVYVNENLATECPSTVTMSFDDADLNIGKGLWGLFANSTTDSVRIYNKALTLTDMINLKMK
jgi:hypothetical protein